MNSELYEKIFDKLVEDARLDDQARNIVDAACSGQDLRKASETDATAQEGASGRRGGERAVVPGVTLRSLEVRGFRGIGPMTTLTFDPGPGLTLVIGRNGSGKSSFAEGLEMLMTGDCARWSKKKAVDWAQGWRNIHAAERPFLRASFAVEGAGEVQVKRVWEGDALEASRLEVTCDKAETDLRALGWETPLTAYRPFLSYSELASLVEEPSRLYDQLESILGLEEVAAARKRVADARKIGARDKKLAKEELERLLPRLSEVDDERARQCFAALSKRKHDLDMVERILAGDSENEAVADVAVVQRLSQLEPPSTAALLESVDAVKQALEAEASLARASVEQAEALTALLESALDLHGHEAGSCPVCEQTLPGDWADRARQRVEESTRSAEAVRKARAATRTAVETLRTRIQRVPADLRKAPELGLGAEALEVWTKWEAAPSDPKGLIAHVEELALGLEEAVRMLRAAAAARRQELFDAWQPVARPLATWIDRARGVEQEASFLKSLKTAEDWLRDVEDELRNDRFEPIAERAQEIWEMLRQESSVALQKVELEKSGKRRKVRLNVTVDEAESVALAVVSQGELNALALSLFLPRMTLPDTPFRFLVVDDPVQAMDPLKVDGLARVLADVSKTRQVIVFTHDTRLAEAVRRLRIPARMVEVLRRGDSTVETRSADDPIQRYLEDAWALYRSEQVLGPKMTARVVPTFCRLAIEAACMATIRRRRIGRGEPHDEVARLLESVKSANDLVALALFDTLDRGGDVLATLNNKLDAKATDAFKAIRAGAH